MDALRTEPSEGKSTEFSKTKSRTAQRISSSDYVVRDVVSGIYEGRYVAGQRLVEPDLMQRYGVGRSTVREAIKRLMAEGVVTVHPFQGAQIRQLSRTEAHNALLVLELLIGLAARLAAARIETPGAREYFTNCFESLVSFESEQDSYELVRARNRFYRAMTRISGNKDLERLIPTFQVHFIRTHVKLPRDVRFDDYRLIAEAVCAGDEQVAETAARLHLRRSAEKLRDLPDHTFAPEQQGVLDSFATDPIATTLVRIDRVRKRPR